MQDTHQDSSTKQMHTDGCPLQPAVTDTLGPHSAKASGAAALLKIEYSMRSQVFNNKDMISWWVRKIVLMIQARQWHTQLHLPEDKAQERLRLTDSCRQCAHLVLHRAMLWSAAVHCV